VLHLLAQDEVGGEGVLRDQKYSDTGPCHCTFDLTKPIVASADLAIVPLSQIVLAFKHTEMFLEAVFPFLILMCIAHEDERLAPCAV
jgi:hypothetical protein